MRPPLLKAVATPLSVVVLATNCLFAHSVEVNFWTERRTTSPTSISARGGEIPARPGLWGISQFGTVRKILKPRGVSKGTVLHIQDIHRNREAQTAISKAVQQLINSDSIDLIALEGAFGPIDLSLFRKFPSRNSVKIVADYLFRENQIAGAIFAAITSDRGGPALIGVDAPSPYAANVNAYKQAKPFVRSRKEEIERSAEKIAVDKKRLFNSKLSTFDADVQRFRSGELSWGYYVRHLCAYSGAIPDDVQGFLSALNMESQIDYAGMESERTALLNKLVGHLTDKQKAELLNASAAYRAGQLGHSDFYLYLKRLSVKRGISLAAYPVFNRYVRYARLADSVDAEKVLEETTAMEKAIYSRLAVTDAEKRLVQKSRELYLIRKLVEFALTKREWEELKLSPWNALIQGPLSSAKMTDLQPFAEFYKQAELRDEAMASNFLNCLRCTKHPVRSAFVLITGGFHSTGIDQRLVDAGYTIVAFVPKISKVESSGGTSYLTVFAQEKTPLEKLFAGEKLFVSPPVVPKNLFPAKIMLDQHVSLLRTKWEGNDERTVTTRARGFGLTTTFARNKIVSSRIVLANEPVPAGTATGHAFGNAGRWYGLRGFLLGGFVNALFAFFVMYPYGDFSNVYVRGGIAAVALFGGVYGVVGFRSIFNTYGNELVGYHLMARTRKIAVEKAARLGLSRPENVLYIPLLKTHIWLNRKFDRSRGIQRWIANPMILSHEIFPYHTFGMIGMVFLPLTLLVQAIWVWNNEWVTHPLERQKLLDQEIRHFVRMTGIADGDANALIRDLRKRTIVVQSRGEAFWRMLVSNTIFFVPLVGALTTVLIFYQQPIEMVVFPAMFGALMIIVLSASSAFGEFLGVALPFLNLILIMDEQMHSDHLRGEVIFHELTHHVFPDWRTGRESVAYAASYMETLRRVERGYSEQTDTELERIRRDISSAPLDQLVKRYKKKAIFTVAQDSLRGDHFVEDTIEPRFSYPFGKELAYVALELLKNDPHKFHRAYEIGVELAQGIPLDRAFHNRKVKILLADEMPEAKINALVAEYGGLVELVSQNGVRASEGRTAKQNLLEIIRRKKPTIMVVRSGTKPDGEILEEAFRQNPGFEIVRAGMGLDGVDLQKADELGVAVKRTGGSENSVANLALRFFLAGLRKQDRNSTRPATVQAALDIANDAEWKQKLGLINLLEFSGAAEKSAADGRGRLADDEFRAIFEPMSVDQVRRLVESRFSGKTIGLYGWGAISQAFASKLKALRDLTGGTFNIAAYSPALRRGLVDARVKAEALDVESMSEHELLTQAHVISLHIPLDESTRWKFVPDSFVGNPNIEMLINTARPSIVQAALVDAAVRDRHEGFFYFADGKFAELDALRGKYPANVFITPHIGANTKDGIDGVEKNTVRTLRASLQERIRRGKGDITLLIILVVTFGAWASRTSYFLIPLLSVLAFAIWPRMAGGAFLFPSPNGEESPLEKTAEQKREEMGSGFSSSLGVDPTDLEVGSIVGEEYVANAPTLESESILRAERYIFIIALTATALLGAFRVPIEMLWKISVILLLLPNLGVALSIVVQHWRRVLIKVADVPLLYMVKRAKWSDRLAIGFGSIFFNFVPSLLFLLPLIALLFVFALFPNFKPVERRAWVFLPLFFFASYFLVPKLEHVILSIKIYLHTKFNVWRGKKSLATVPPSTNGMADQLPESRLVETVSADLQARLVRGLEDAVPNLPSSVGGAEELTNQLKHHAIPAAVRSAAVGLDQALNRAFQPKINNIQIFHVASPEDVRDLESVILQMKKNNAQRDDGISCVCVVLARGVDSEIDWSVQKLRRATVTWDWVEIIKEERLIAPGTNKIDYKSLFKIAQEGFLAKPEPTKLFRELYEGNYADKRLVVWGHSNIRYEADENLLPILTLVVRVAGEIYGVLDLRNWRERATAA